MAKESEITDESAADGRRASRPLPDGWKWATLGEVCLPVESTNPKRHPEHYFRYVDISSIDRQTKRITAAKRIRGGNAPSRARQRIHTNDILVSTTRPNLNAVALVPNDLDDEVCSTGFCVLRPTAEVLPEFLYGFVRTQKFVGSLSDQATGSSYPAVTDKQVKAVTVPLPPMVEQKRIVSAIEERFRSINAATREAETQIEASGSMIVAYLRAVFPSVGDELPRDWMRRRLGEVCEVIPGQSPPGSSYNDDGEGIEFHQGKAAFGQRYLESSGKWTTHARRFAEHGDLVMSIRAPVGPVNATARRVAIGRGLASLRADASWVVPEWLFHFVRSIQPELTGTQGTTFASINKREIEEIPVPFCSLHEQKRIIDRIECRLELLDSAKRASQTQRDALESLSNAYLTQAFSGGL